jgi:uncharacterized protein
MTIRGIASAFLVVALIACRRDPAPTTTGSAGSADPWSAPAITDDLPDSVGTRALADKACPRVVAPYYFRVSKDGKTSFMLGTRHLGVPLAKLPAGVKEQLKKAELVVFETPPGDDSGDGEKPPKGPPLPEQLGDALWTKYKRLVGEQTASSLEHATPAVALIALMMLYEDKLSALDVEIEQAVTEANIPTGGLETSAFQDKLLEELLDLRMLKATLAGTADRKQIEKESLDDLAEYCRGTDTDPGMDERTKKVLKAGGYTDAEIKKLDERLLDDRNRAWIPQLETLFAKGNVFVVVGADHLIGPQGVIKTLESKGYQTARLAN